MQKQHVIFFVFIWIVSIVVIVATLTIRQNREITYAIETLKLLYDFETLEEFNTNIEEFEAKVTPEVFERMSANNTDRVLHVYLKFRGNPCTVNVLEAKPGYIVYNLLSESIESSKRYLFLYEIKGGKISDITEADLFVLPTSRDWDVDPNLLPPINLPYGGD